MDAKLASGWSSVNTIGEESDMIAHLQSMFWSCSDVDLSLCSSNISSSSCVTTSTMHSSTFFSLIDNESYDTMPWVKNGIDVCQDNQHHSLVPTTKAVTGDKRIFLMDEQKNPNKKLRAVPSIPRTRSSTVLCDEVDTEIFGKDYSSCSSEENSVGTSKKSVVLNQSDKSRAHKRSSRDLQSLYAKKRRERINERLRTLQKLIPNGTKVDISTMLEEAVQYVKFLQLQIKLLSSDETWMYAPLAYNGVNVGLDLNISAVKE